VENNLLITINNLINMIRDNLRYKLLKFEI